MTRPTKNYGGFDTSAARSEVNRLRVEARRMLDAANSIEYALALLDHRQKEIVQRGGVIQLFVGMVPQPMEMPLGIYEKDPRE